MAEPAKIETVDRRTGEELDYALNQVRVMRAQLASAAPCAPESPARRSRQRLHAVLDRIQAVTPEFARAMIRRYYLRFFYYRLYPQHSPAAVIEPLPPADADLAHSGYAPLLAFKQNLCRSLPMELAGVSAPSKLGLVSVVLPVYNGEKYVAGAVESVLRQTHGNFELIIVNDGSTDSTAAILERYSADPRVRICSQENQKLPAALNAGFREASGEFFTWISADNVADPEMLQVLAQFLHSRPDVEMVYADEQLINDAGEPAYDTDFNPGYQAPPGSHILRRPRDPGELNFVQNNYIGACFMYRAWAGRVLGEYDSGCFGFEDYDYWMRMNALFRIAHLGDGRILYSYRLHSESLSAREQELRISERARYFLPVEAERRRFFAEPFDIDLAGEHRWFDELASIYRRSGHNARRIQPGGPGRYIEEMTRAYRKRIVISSEPSPESFAVVNGRGVRCAGFELRAGNPSAIAWPLLAAANSRLWRACG